MPYYPPVENSDDYSEARCLQLIRDSLGDNASQILDFKIIQVGSWRMEALVASAYQSEMGRVFLAGDSAHAYPPSGGFGLNTGIGDAFNLAHKLASGEAIDKYSSERQPIGSLTRDSAITNYNKSLKIAQKLGLNASHASLVTSLVHNVVPRSVIDSKSLLQGVMSFGLQATSSIFSTVAAAKYLKQDPRHSIKLLFPNLDFNFNYRGKNAFLLQNWDNLFIRKNPIVGDLVPVCWLKTDDTSNVISLRQWMSRYQYEAQKSLAFEFRL